MGYRSLSKALVVVSVSALSVVSMASGASAAADDLFGLRLDFVAQGSPTGTFDANYLTLQGDGELSLALHGQNFTAGSSQEITVHKGTCAAPGPEVDRFELDLLLRLLPLDPNPRAISLLEAPVFGTPGALRYVNGSISTLIPVADVGTFESNHVVIVNEIGSLPTDYFCGTPVDRVSLGTSDSAGTEYPLFFRELNSSGVTATGSATLFGNTLTLDLSYAGVSNAVDAHFQLLRQGAECPIGDTTSLAEVDGTVELALTDGVRSVLPIDVLSEASFLVHPTANVDGTLQYLAEIALTADQVAAFATSTILIHGFDANENGIADGGPGQIGSLTADETAPAGCGRFAPLPPSAPTGVTASVDGTSVTVTWEAPVDDGGAPITGYTVTLSDETPITVSGTETSAVFEGVEPGSHTASVAATNLSGDSPESEPSNEVSVVVAPGAPTDVEAIFEYPVVLVSWLAPLDEGGAPITSYTVSVTDGASTTETTIDGPLTEAEVGGLEPGVYTATVVAANSAGSSPASDPSAEVEVTPLPKPGPVLNVGLRAVGQKVIVTWDPPANAEEAQVEGYEVLLSNGETVTVSGTVAQFLEQGTGALTASVAAFNADGLSEFSPPSAPVQVRDCQDGDVDADWDPLVFTPDEGALFRLYCGYFLRYPDEEGFNYWKSIQAGGADLSTISDLFASSAEFDNTYGELNNDEFVRLLYKNVLLRPVEPEGYNYWKGFLDRGELSQGGTMRWVSQSREFKNVTGTP